jgi:hypothetical protein
MNDSKRFDDKVELHIHLQRTEQYEHKVKKNLKEREKKRDGERERKSESERGRDRERERVLENGRQNKSIA